MNVAIKPTYLLIGAILVLGACTQEDMPGHVGGDSNRIVFSTSLPDVASRAEVVAKDNLTHFYVTAFDRDDQSMIKNGILEPNFAQEKVEIIKDKDFYTSPNCVWPDRTKSGDVVTFFGFYPDLEIEGGAQPINPSATDAFDYKFSGFTVASDIAGQVDLITARATGSMDENQFSGIKLDFAHQLSRIEIKAYGAHKSCDIEFAGVRIGGVNMKGSFSFMADGSAWSDITDKGLVEYIFRKNDKIITCGKNHAVKEENAFSLMGNGSCAMLIPSAYTPWDYVNDNKNTKNEGLYISVLLRIVDATSSEGIQQYPYLDRTQGDDALEILPAVSLAVDINTGNVEERLYKSGTDYFTDKACSEKYARPENVEIKDFGWASVPVAGDWKAGYIYTYTLDFTVGVGLHDPGVTTSAPTAGDPIISDQVGMFVTVDEWKSLTTPGYPPFEVPGS